MMAENTAARATGPVTASLLTIPFPTVEATATPKINGPKNTATATQDKAQRGGTAREAIAVATILELSLEPVINPKARVATINISS